MKIVLSSLVLLFSLAVCFGQGQVLFQNTRSTLVTTSSVAGGPATGPISGPMGTYHFALFMAPAGTVDTSAFAYTGASAMNIEIDGYFSGGDVNVDALPGTTRSFLIRGWSANIGSSYESLTEYLSHPTFTGWYGQSQIATVVVGSQELPVPSVLFGSGQGQIPGFNLNMVPEPSALALGSLGVGIFLLLRRRIRQH